MVKKTDLDLDELRNHDICFATERPYTLKKGLITGVLTLVVTKLFVVDYFEFWQTAIVTGIMLAVFMWVYDFLFFRLVVEPFYENLPTVVIGFSNEVHIVQDDIVHKTVETDEIIFRKIKLSERISYYGFSTMLELRKEGEIVQKIVVNYVKEYRGVVLKPIPSRVNEDLEVFDVVIEEESEEDK